MIPGMPCEHGQVRSLHLSSVSISTLRTSLVIAFCLWNNLQRWHEPLANPTPPVNGPFSQVFIRQQMRSSVPRGNGKSGEEGSWAGGGGGGRGLLPHVWIGNRIEEVDVERPDTQTTLSLLPLGLRKQESHLGPCVRSGHHLRS